MSVCESCRGMNCPDYYRYLQLSLFPGLVSNEKARRKFQPEGIPVVNRPDSKPPQQISWLEKPDVTLPEP